MVSLDHISELDTQYQWIIVVLTVASMISMLSGLLYCVCFGGLFRGSSLTQELSINPMKAHNKNKQRCVATPRGISPATTATQAVSVQQSVRSKKTKVGNGKKVQKKFLGKLQLHAVYVKSKSVLEVRIMCAQNLPAKDISGKSDPFCKLLLLPARDKKISTKVKQRTLSPIWNETICFVLTKSQLSEQTLYVYVLDHDHINKDKMIGECRFNLCNLDLERGQTVTRELSPFEGYAHYLGEILLSLSYSASKQKLTIHVLKCTNLKAMDTNNLSDPYVKLFRWKAGKKFAKRKTTTKLKTRNPVFNESFHFEIALTQIRGSNILIQVMDYDRMKHNDSIGCVVLGEGPDDFETLHWKEMCNNMDKTIAQWHRLKASTDD